MKNFSCLLLATISLILICCSGSDVYRGKWKATSQNGEKLEIVFDEKKLTVTDSTNKNVTMAYTQNSVKIENSIKTYGIQLEDGRAYQIKFPVPGNEKVAVIIDGAGELMYTICRTEYVTAGDIYKIK